MSKKVTNNDAVDTEKKKKSGAGKAVGGVAGLGIIGILLYLFLNGKGLGLGDGSGFFPGQNDTPSQSESQTQDDNSESQKQEIPANVIVTIQENEVTINGNPVADADALKKYVEEYNSDSRTFELQEDKSIVETYNWVVEVFDSLGIDLKNAK